MFVQPTPASPMPMAASKKLRTLRLTVGLSLALLAPPWLAAQQKPKSLPAQQWINLPPQVAATHLIKKVTPKYPAFAKAAGIQGIVRIGVAISLDGRVHSIGGPVSGWACLWKAAMTAARLYAYRPFMKDGHPVGVKTTEDIVFKLPGQHSVFQPPQPPQLTFGDFTNGPHVAFQNTTPVADGPPEIRKWLLSRMQKDPLYALWAKQGAFKSMKYGLPAKMVEIQTGVPTSRNYLITDNVVSPGLGLGAVLCGTGINCGVWLAEDDAGTVHGLGTSGCYYYVWQRKGSPYPDIFIAFATSHALDVYGYVNAGGYWGPVYYGSILGTSHEGIHVFRHWLAPTLAARQEPEIPPIRQFFKLPPEVANTHLIKKVAPIYPAFAKAAGIEEVSRVAVVISPSGRIHGSGPATGWACLTDAAMTAAGQYVYKPFERNRHPIYVETTENIVFKLPGQHSAFHPPRPPQFGFNDLNGWGDALPASQVPPEIRTWLARQFRRDNPSCEANREALASSSVVEVATGKPGTHLYILHEGNSACPNICGATGNCPIQVVEDESGRVRKVADSGGWNFYVWRRRGSVYPVVFVVWNMSAGESDVAGYVNVHGLWGPIYCGRIFTDGSKSDIHLCRQ